MKYIFNSGRYAYTYEIQRKGKPVNVTLDRRRIYTDTGNIATSGVTELSDEDFELLSKNRRFAKDLENGLLSLTEPSQLETAESKAKALEAENKELKSKLEKAEKAGKGGKNAEAEKQLKEKDKEIKSLKAQLEAYNKKDGTEGF